MPDIDARSGLEEAHIIHARRRVRRDGTCSSGAVLIAGTDFTTSSRELERGPAMS
ncbi:MAG: hypothetical protein GX607_22910 [Myxococcales bacterium]|nr:hypothetical protein [Myxococcales bacterium]